MGPLTIGVSPGDRINDLNEGAPALPSGAANTVFADWLASVPVNVPEPVTGELVTVINEGNGRIDTTQNRMYLWLKEK